MTQHKAEENPRQVQASRGTPGLGTRVASTNRVVVRDVGGIVRMWTLVTAYLSPTGKKTVQ